MKKFCKPLLVYMILITAVLGALALFSAFAAFGALYSEEKYGLGWLFFLSLIFAPGTLVGFLGAIFGWIGGFLQKTILSLISTIVISFGFAMWFWMLLPWGVIIAFVIAVIPGLVCYKKQSEYIKAQKAPAERELSATAD
ncbi:MAG: hypothetical protein IJ939_05205 [Clostridia bacterium]|nr:hypothetical protein [Clostridia bacterium]